LRSIRQIRFWLTVTEPRLFPLNDHFHAYGLSAEETNFLYSEIFESPTYFQNGIDFKNARTVVDVGANIGMFTLFAASHLDANGKIYAFEPNPEVVRSLRKNIEHHGSNALYFPYALSDVSGPLSFSYSPLLTMMAHIHANGEAFKIGNLLDLVKTLFLCYRSSKNKRDLKKIVKTSLKIAFSFFNQVHVQTEMKTLSDVIQENGIEQIDILKIDAEGSEWKILNGISDQDWHKIHYIVMEAHPTYVEGDLMGDLTALLTKKGFKITVDEEAFDTRKIFSHYFGFEYDAIASVPIKPFRLPMIYASRNKS